TTVIRRSSRVSASSGDAFPRPSVSLTISPSNILFVPSQFGVLANEHHRWVKVFFFRSGVQLQHLGHTARHAMRLFAGRNRPMAAWRRRVPRYRSAPSEVLTMRHGVGPPK